MMQNPKHQKQLKLAGYSLVELMITLAVIGVLLAIGVPAIQNFTQNNRLSTETNQALSEMAYARSEAVKRNSPVTLCPSANSNSSTANCSDNWTTGVRIVFLDPNADGVMASAGDMLRVYRTPPAGQVWTAVQGDAKTADFATATPIDGVNFIGSGMVDNIVGVVSSGGSALAFELRDSRSGGLGECHRVIGIAITGRAEFDRDASGCNL